MNRHAKRVHAMRLANTLARFDRSEFKYENRRGAGVEITRQDVPNPFDWPFIDLDPLLGEVEEILVDDGVRATWPIDYSACLPMGDSMDDWRIVRGHTITARDARLAGCRIFSPKMMNMEQITFQNGRYDFGGARIAMLGGVWVDAYRGPVSSAKDMAGGRNGNGDSPEKLTVGASVVGGAALRLRYEWSAIFSFPTGIRLRFGTTPEGAMAIFKDRERADGVMRRPPILHWVRRHWRRGNISADMVREVRKHLRGREEFSWFGLPVTLIPAEYDVERAAA